MMTRRCMALLCLGLCAASPAALAAKAGELLFVVGGVNIEHAGQRVTGFRGSVVEVGDTIHTDVTGRTQLMMEDGGLIFLRPNTSFVIESMTMRAPVEAATGAYAAPAAKAAAPASGRLVMSLLRGGFRTISGFLGKAAGDEYRMKTPVATIGIRGTDYTAVYCSGNCAGSRDGLHVSVSHGQIAIANNGGEINLYNSQYAYVGSANEAPSRTTEPAPALQDPLPAGEGEGGGDAPQNQVSEGTLLPDPEDAPPVTGGNPESVPPNPPEELTPFDPRHRSYAFAGSDPVAAGVGRDSISTLTVDEQGGLTRFRGDFRPTPQSALAVVQYSIGSSSNVNLGYDPVTGIGWGRWHGGAADAGGHAIDLSNQSLHWIYGPEHLDNAALPLGGVEQYSLVGNTDPTDNLGNVGLLGSSTLTADFTHQTVTNDLSLSINSQVWTASGSGSIIHGTPAFAGTYANGNVTVNGATTGSGDFAGFFTPPPHEGAAPAGAGLSYNLNNGSGTSVSGTAAYGNAPVSQTTSPAVGN